MNKFVFVVIITSVLTRCWAASPDKIRVFDFKYKTFEFFDGDISVELPDNPRHEITSLYYKVLVNYALSWDAGHYEISTVNLNKYMGPKEDKFKNKLETKIEKNIKKDYTVIFRMVYWQGENPVVLTVSTSWDEGIYPIIADWDDRIKKDDEIFEHIIESFRYRKEDGTYAKPEIIRQPEEVKEIEHTGSEYHGNSD